MKATKTYPIYTAVAVNNAGTQYKLNKITTDLSINEPKTGIADKVELGLLNIPVDTSTVYKLIAPGMKLFIFADDGTSGEKEIFRGMIWSRNYKSDNQKNISITAYTNLIYFQKSNDCLYFSAGKTTDSIIMNICSKWGVKCQYLYDSITHPKLPLNNKALSDMFVTVLDEVKKIKGTKYVIRSVKDVVSVQKCGINADVYYFKKKESILNFTVNETLDDVVTQVIVVGKEDSYGRAPVEATIKGNNVKQYGTLQQVISRDEGTTLDEAKQEANTLLKDNGLPNRTYTLSSIDVPWLHKGDKIHVETDEYKGFCYVLSVTHNAVKKTMDLDIEEV